MSVRAKSRDHAAWQTRLINDQQRTRDFLPAGLRTLHDAVTARARESHAQALLLTGSTARGTRTAVSDLDYHLIGEPIVTDDLSGELDLHVLSATLLNTRLREGDDFTQLSLRFGSCRLR